MSRSHLVPPSEGIELGLSECDKEPIHIPGSIQPHGVLLVFDDAGMRVLQTSRNAAQVFGRPLDAILNATLADLFGERQAEAFLPALAAITADGNPRYLGVTPLGEGAQPELFTVIAHRHDGALIVELEPLGADQPTMFENIYPLSNAFIARVQSARTFDALCGMAAAEIRRLTGFDRVLIYRFDPEWHGTVVAEDRNEVFPSLLDHRFPASDIPKPARELYRKNRLRLIADADYTPVPIVPALRPDTERSLDLTYATLRSVSPVHVEYMKNMKTASSMSISILREGELWGLIACHHGSPRRVPFLVRTACEMLGQVLSLLLEARDHHNEYQRRIELKSIQVKLLAQMTAAEDYRDGLAREPAELLAFASATGAAVVAEDRCTLIGETPNEAEVRRLANWLTKTVRKEVFASSSLSAEFPEAMDYAEVASGLLAISISKLHPSYVLWFRPEAARTVKWAGNPRKPVSFENGIHRLNPRTSFELWQETVRHTAVPFRPSELEAAVEFRNSVIGVVLRRAEEMAELTSELERSNKELEAFSYSVSHDLRAPFRHIAGYAELLRESADDRLDPDEKRYIEVISSSAQQAGLLVDSLLGFSRMGRQKLNYHRVDMNDLVKEVQRTFARDESHGHKITWRVSTLPTVNCDMLMIRQVVQNLLSNAIKFTRTRSEAVIEIGCESSSEEDTFFVKDNGVGFDMLYVDKLFGVFQRLHRMEDFDGTGIGLANVRRIISRHGGRTWAEGKLGEGASFYFTLPKTTVSEESR